MSRKFRFLVAALLACTCVGQALSASPVPSPSGKYRQLGCVHPTLMSYWISPTAEEDPFIVVYSIQGFWADLKKRLPADILDVMVHSSKTALEVAPIALASRDMDVVEARFYEAFEAELAKREGQGRSADACAIDSGHLQAMLQQHYRFLLQDAEMDAWYQDAGIDELSVRNEQFAALISVGSSVEGYCKEVHSVGRKTLIACQ